MQDVTPIDLPQGTGHDETLNICRRRCRSDHFVLIDDYREISETFLLGAAMSAEAGQNSTEGYRLYKPPVEDQGKSYTLFLRHNVGEMMHPATANGTVKACGGSSPLDRTMWHSGSMDRKLGYCLYYP